MRRLSILSLGLIVSSCALVGGDERKDPSPGTVRVVEYQGRPLLERDAVVTDPTGVRVWEGKIEEQTVVLSRVSLCGDECNETHRLALKETERELPRFKRATFRRKASDGASPLRVTEQRSLETGTVAIQEWNTDGVVSGKVTGDLEFVFWYDFGTQRKMTPGSASNRLISHRTLAGGI